MTINTWNDRGGWQSCDDEKQVVFDNGPRAPLFVLRGSLEKNLDPGPEVDLEINSSYFFQFHKTQPSCL